MSSSRTPISWTVFGATVIGNALEFFDFGVYAFFAVMIGKVFFPVDSPTGQLLLSFAAFGVGFIMRPIGAVVIGSYADRAGRRAALTVTIFFMAAGTGLIAVTPSYASIGVLAPISIVIARLLQGFSAGGEVGVATSYLVEVAPHGRRGMYGSLQTATQGVANIGGAAMGFGLSLVLSDRALTQWGWRVPFIFGLVIAPVGLFIRRQLPETADLAEVPRTSLHVIRDLLTKRLVRPMVLCGLSIVGATITSYVLVHYITSYAMTVLAMPTSTAMAVAVVSGITGCVASLLGGWLSDHVGRRWMMIAPRLVLLVLVVPVFGAIIAARTPFALIAGITLLTFFHATSGAAFIVAMPECFPRSVRSLGAGVVYAVSVTIFGGSASAIATWLVAVTHSAMAPAWYLVVANAVSLVALLALKVPRPNEAID
jgi:MFS family permease